MPKFSRETPISSVPDMSPTSVEAFRAAGYEKLGDIDELDFLRVSSLLTRGSEVPVLYKAAISSGIKVLFPRNAPVEVVPGLSRDVLRAIHAAGFSHLQDFEGLYFPEIYKLVGDGNVRRGYGRVKPLLLALVLAGVAVKFTMPCWSDADWKGFLQAMIEADIVSWEDVVVAVCGELNPPQVGTAVANAVKHNYPRRKTMQEVWKWLYNQDGKCAVSGKRLFLEADHIRPREIFIKEGRNVKDADTLDNFQLLTKRENVIKRGSHKLGGLSFAPAASVLIYVMLRYRPESFDSFAVLCREHGLTMSEIRFQEAWAFAVWLSKEGKYRIVENTLPFMIGSDDDDDALDEE